MADNINSVLVIGLGLFGRHTAQKFEELGIDVMGVDKEENRVSAALSFLTRGVIGDATNREFLRSLGINNFDICVVTIGDQFQPSLETTLTLKELGAKHVVSRASSAMHEKFLLRNGADDVIYPERQEADWLAYRFSSPHIFDYTKLDRTNSIFEIDVPRQWVNKSMAKLDVRRNFGINIIGIKQPNKNITIAVNPDQKLTTATRLVVAGDAKEILKLFN